MAPTSIRPSPEIPATVPWLALAVASPVAPTAVAVVVTRLAVVPALAVITPSLPRVMPPLVPLPVPEMPNTLWLASASEAAGKPMPPTLVLLAVISESTPAVRVPVDPTVMPVSKKPKTLPPSAPAELLPLTEVAEAGPVMTPVIVYTGRELTPAEEEQLSSLADRVIIKGAASPDQLFAESALHLHRNEELLPEPKRQMLRDMDRRDPVLLGRDVLIVDDDMRNIFALSSVLERYGMKVVYAENGLAAIERLQAAPRFDAVLMDIMMPQMDGYETIRQIRTDPRFDELPIIGLSAKAMKGDREKCLDAGASDYITKPVNVEHLLSVLRVYFYAPARERDLAAARSDAPGA